MDLFEELRRETIRAQDDYDLPDFLAEQIFRIADNRQEYAHLHAEIGELVNQIRQYDTYGQTGYLGMGVNNVILQGTLRRLTEKRGRAAG